MIDQISIPFIIGIIFGAGSFYGLTIFRLNNQEKKFEELQKRIENKLDQLSCDIRVLAERVSKLEGKINGKQI
ncbi:MAG: hypothetical protein QXJ14_03450 [Candidatus Aenigmatarchaeota archaeon]